MRCRKLSYDQVDPGLISSRHSYVSFYKQYSLYEIMRRKWNYSSTASRTRHYLEAGGHLDFPVALPPGESSPVTNVYKAMRALQPVKISCEIRKSNQDSLVIQPVAYSLCHLRILDPLLRTLGIKFHKICLKAAHYFKLSVTYRDETFAPSN